LKARGRKPRYIQQAVGQVRRIADECKWVCWSDISASRLDTWLNELADGEDAAADRTANGYLTAVKAFCRWMVKDRRASETPLAHLEKRDETPSYERGAFTVDEMRRLLGAASVGSDCQGMTGTERALLYRLAAETGFRANEIRQMTVSRFELDTDRPTATATKWTTKGWKARTVRLRLDTSAELRTQFTGKLPTALAFPTMPDSTHTAEMIRFDMARAVPPIPETDASDRVRHFHSLRHTTGSFFNAAGVNPKVAQNILGHSNINLTMGIYTHTYRDDEAAAVMAIPDLSSPTNATRKATGTEDATAAPGAVIAPSNCLPLGLSPEGIVCKTSAEFPGARPRKANEHKMPENPGKTANFQANGRGRIRTCEGRAIRFTV
jgi:integrase